MALGSYTITTNIKHEVGWILKMVLGFLHHYSMTLMVPYMNEEVEAKLIMNLQRSGGLTGGIDP
jgi:hypothetical protein